MNLNPRCDFSLGLSPESLPKIVTWDETPLLLQDPARCPASDHFISAQILDMKTLSLFTEAKPDLDLRCMEMFSKIYLIY